MSYDLAVWEGPAPASDRDALATYSALSDEWLGGQHGDQEPTHTLEELEPSEAIKSYVAALLARWPDIDEPDGEDSPWADGPLIINASGPFFSFAMVFSMADEGAQFAAAVAAKRGLVCFDPQSERLLAPTRAVVSEAGPQRRRFWKRS